MSFNIWIDASTKSSHKRILNELEKPVDNTNLELWSSIGSHEWNNFLTALSITDRPSSPEEIGKPNTVCLKELRPFIHFYEKIVTNKIFHKMARLYSYDETASILYFNKTFYSDAESLKYEWLDNLEKYNSIKNSDIAKAIRQADLDEYNKQKQLLEYNSGIVNNWLGEALEKFDNYIKDDIKDVLLLDISHFMCIIELAHIIKIASEIYGEKYQLKIAAG